MVATPLGPQRRLLVAGAGLAIAFCAAVPFLHHAHLLHGDLLVAMLAALVGCCAALILWQDSLLSRSGERQRLQRAIIDSSPNAVLISDSRGRITDLNPAAERIFAREARTIATAHMSDLIVAPLGSEATPASVHANVLDRLGQKMVVEGHRPDGTSFPVEVSVLRVGTGAHTLFAAYMRDLTDQHRASAEHEERQARVHQSEKMSAMGSLLAGVAHELNNPLAILVTQASLLRDKAPTPDVARRAERIHAAAQRAGRIVKSFLAMARQKAPVRAPVDLNGVVEASVELVAYGLRSAGIKVDLELAPDLPLIDADRDLIGQVIVNLLINAQQALADRPEPRIHIGTSGENETATLDISDNGPGIPDTIRDRIFEPYFTTKPVGAGTGIGLSICRNVVAAHGGRIEALQAETGARIRVVLPTARPIATRPRTETGEGMSVLVVDDEIDVAESLAELMDIFGHRVVVSASATDALDRLKQQCFDAVFTDLRMPGMSGLSFRQQIRAIDPALAGRTVIMTGDTVTGLQPDTDTVNDILVLEKPFTADNVRAMLEQVRGR